MATFADSVRSEDEIMRMCDFQADAARKGLPVAPENMEQLDEGEIADAKKVAMNVITKFIQKFSSYAKPISTNCKMGLLYGIQENVITFKFTNLIDTMRTYVSMNDEQRRLLSNIENDSAAYPCFKKLVSGLITLDFAYDEGGNEVFIHLPKTKFKVIAESLDTEILSLINSMSLRKNMIKRDFGKSISEIVNEFMINEVYPEMGITNQERYQKFAGLRKERGKGTKPAPKLGATVRSSRPKVVEKSENAAEVVRTVIVRASGKTITINSETEIGDVVIDLIGGKMTITI